MAGGAGSSYRDWNPDQLSRALREESEKAVEAFDVDLAEYLNELLGMFNGRDVQLTRDRLVEALEVLTEDLRGARDLMFGGSVAKHTYVDGLSDIDSLLILDGPKYEGRSPKAARRDRAATGPSHRGSCRRSAAHSCATGG